MALIKCVECGREISDKASSCPNCGAPVAAQNGVVDETKESKYAPKTKKPLNKAVLITSIGWILVLACLILVILIVHKTPAPVTLIDEPVTLIDEIENLPANSLKTLPFTLPYSGTVNIIASVVNGNNIDFEVINQDQKDFDNLKSGTPYGANPNFSATKSRYYKRSHAMDAGNYYLLLRDKTLGILSSPASDVRVLVRLTP